MECRPNRRRLTRTAWFQAISVRQRLRGSRNERTLLGCSRARFEKDLKERADIRLSYVSLESVTLDRRKLIHFPDEELGGLHERRESVVLD